MRPVTWAMPLVAALAWACSDGGASNVDDSGGTVDAELEAEAGPPPRCDITKPFGAPTTDATLSFNGHGGYAFLSSDELTGYVSADIYGSCSIWAATRPSNDVAFGQPSLAGSLNGASVQESVSLTEDGLTAALVRLSTYSSNDGKIFIAQRPSQSAAFSTPVEQAGLDNANSSNRSPYLSADGKSLYYASNQSGAFELYVAHGQSGSFAGAQLVSFGSPPASDAFSPVLSPDELTIYFGAAVGASSGPHVQTATRPSVSSPFGAAQPVDTVNDYTSVADYPSWISADGCVLYTYRVKYINAYVANVMVSKRPL